ncbi:MAG: SOS response-associated peptidase [Aquaticitalea sp.]
MCYDIKATQEAQLKRARLKGGQKVIDEIMETLIDKTDLPLYHTKGFSHPELLIYTDRSPDFPEVATWGLVPHWVKNQEQLKKSWNNTLNARGETIFEKNSFRESAKHSRCLVYVDGFYEHHHFGKNTYPFFIQNKNKEPFALAGLYSEWTDPETKATLNTFSIVTTTGNKMLAKIHNNPKLEGPRMPVIFHKEMEDKWLNNIIDELDKTAILDLIQEYPHEELEAYPVARLSGKDYQGNIPEISEPMEYPELAFADLQY